MKNLAISLALTSALLTLAAPQSAQAQQAAAAPKSANGQQTLNFDGKRYLHRYSKNGQHEFTPAGQEDLQRWQEMLTLVMRPGADAENTRQWAEAMAAGYKEKGLLVQADQPPGGEYRMLGVLGAPGMTEVNFVRVMPHGSGAMTVLVQRRFYGEESRQMADWVRDNSPRLSGLLVDWQPPAESQIKALPESP